jgi:hypothetical protein
MFLCFYVFMNTRITADLKDIRLIQLIKIEANEKGCTQAEVLIHSLEAYFTEKLENNLIQKASEKAFSDWDNTKDALYDNL